MSYKKVKIVRRVTLLTTILCFLNVAYAEVPSRDDAAAIVNPAEEVGIKHGKAAEQSTLSESKQFVVTGSEVALRAAMTFLAEQTKREILDMLKEKDEWNVPISMVLVGKKNDAIVSKSVVFQCSIDEIKGVTLRIYLHLSEGINEKKVKAAIIQSLLYERYLRDKKSSDLQAELLIRPWLTEGIAEAIDWKSGKRDRRRLYQLLFQSDGIFRLDELLITTQAKFDTFDSAMLSIFQASAGSLIMALIEQPQGYSAFSQFLSEAAGFSGDISVLLAKHFPQLHLSNKSLEKWWSLQMANQGRNSLEEVMSITESENTLADALRLQFPAEKDKNRYREISEWESFLALDDASRITGVRQAQQKIERLSYRCFPSYRNVLEGYQMILRSLVSKKSTDVISKKMAELEEMRSLMIKKSRRGTDFLDWHEITRARETTGVFEDYIQAKQRINQKPLQSADHVSRYLDKAQSFYERNDNSARSK